MISVRTRRRSDAGSAGRNWLSDGGLPAAHAAEQASSRLAKASHAQVGWLASIEMLGRLLVATGIGSQRSGIRRTIDSKEMIPGDWPTWYSVSQITDSSLQPPGSRPPIPAMPTPD